MQDYKCYFVSSWSGLLVFWWHSLYNNCTKTCSRGGGGGGADERRVSEDKEVCRSVMQFQFQLQIVLAWRTSHRHRIARVPWELHELRLLLLAVVITHRRLAIAKLRSPPLALRRLLPHACSISCPCFMARIGFAHLQRRHTTQKGAVVTKKHEPARSSQEGPNRMPTESRCLIALCCSCCFSQ
jgi:hypothetical protein